LLGTGSGVQMPQFQNTQQQPVAPTDVMGAYQMNYQGQLANSQAQNQSQQAAQGGLYGLGSAAIMAAAMF